MKRTVDDDFVLQGNPDTPAGLKGVLFTPVLEEKERTTRSSAARPW